MSTLNLLILGAFLLGLSIGAFVTAIWYRREPNKKKNEWKDIFDEADIYNLEEDALKFRRLNPLTPDECIALHNAENPDQFTFKINKQ